MDTDKIWGVLLVLVVYGAFALAFQWSGEQGKRESAYEQCLIERALDVRLAQTPVRICVDPSQGVF